MSSSSPRGHVGSGTVSRWSLRILGLGFLALLLVAPLVIIFFETFKDGISAPLDAITSENGLHALKLSLLMVAIAVPLNTVFGIVCAILLVRHKWKGNAVIDAVINLPFALSPIVIGLALYLLYSTNGGWFGPTLGGMGIEVLFSVPGMVLASIFVSLPFVVRETVPVLQEIGTGRRRRRSGPMPGRPSAASPCRRSAGASPTASSSPPPACWASSGR
jgi:sulfate transport system permease protein